MSRWHTDIRDLTDQHELPLPWHAQQRARLAAEGGPTLQTAVQAMAGRMWTAVQYLVADGRVLFRPHEAAGGWRVFDGAELSLWAAGALTHEENLTVTEWHEVADLVRPRLLAEHSRLQAQRPAALREADAAVTAQRLADRRADLTRQRDAADAELAALEGRSGI